MAAREAIGTPPQSADATGAPGSGAPSLGSRAERSRLPVAKHVVEAAAVSGGVCVHPVPVRRIDPQTGASEIVDVPCGATLESKCPPCTKRARSLRIAQCRAGWHLDAIPPGYLTSRLAPHWLKKEEMGALRETEEARTYAIPAGTDLPILLASAAMRFSDWPA